MSIRQKRKKERNQFKSRKNRRAEERLESRIMGYERAKSSSKNLEKAYTKPGAMDRN